MERVVQHRCNDGNEITKLCGQFLAQVDCLGVEFFASGFASRKSDNLADLVKSSAPYLSSISSESIRLLVVGLFFFIRSDKSGLADFSFATHGNDLLRELEKQLTFQSINRCIFLHATVLLALSASASVSIMSASEDVVVSHLPGYFVDN
jgi:hypothetical protein